ncbi:ABC transporter permease [Megasphaera sp.]|uniref:ABC transporter permease n=1 Tax=Megasphaera sp. TaxID=2023260 RepID=UPI003FEEABE5
MDTFRLTFYKIYQLIVKELLTTLKDPKSRVILVIPVLVQGLLFGYTATYNLDNVPYALVDEDHSRESADFIAHLDGTGIFQRVQTLSSTQQIAQAIDSGEAMIVITIPSDFARRLNSGQEAPIQTVTDGRNPMTAGLAASYAASIVSAMNVQRIGHQPLIEIRSRIWYNPNNITRRIFLPSLIPMLALTQVLILAGLSVARERENGTFDQLLVTPLTPPEILIGKAVPPILIGLVQATLMLCIAVFWFKIQLVGSLAALYLTIFIFLVSCVGLGLSISAVAKNMQQVMVYCFLFLMPMILLSGLATPVRNMPQVLQYVTYINPMRFAIEAIRRIYLEGAGIPVIAYTYLPMLAVAAVTLPLAAWLFRHKLS